MKLNQALTLSVFTLISACSGNKPVPTSTLLLSDKHIQAKEGATSAATQADIPQTSSRTVALPPPKPSAKVETYTVVVANVPAREVLFALAQDAKINIDIAAGLEGYVSLNAINQTLPQILDRISKQIEMRYEFNNGNLFIQPDKAYLKNYKIDFINMSRKVSNNSVTSTLLAGGASAGGGILDVKSVTDNNLMDSLVKNVYDIILEEDKLHYQERTELQSKNSVSSRGDGFASGSSSMSSPQGNNNIQIGERNSGGGKTGAAISGNGNQDVQGQGNLSASKGVYERAVTVFANKETGILIVRANSRQHRIVQEFIDKVMNAAKQQVLIEATIAEVTLSDSYQQGIDWSNTRLGSVGFQLTQKGTGTLTAAPVGGFIKMDYANPSTSVGTIAASISALQSFGSVKVLSSPKLSVMNNQTATLKVVDNKVYFQVQATTTPATNTSAALTTYSTTAIPVTVGFVMSVTPQISEGAAVTMNVKPSITRISEWVNDPNPQLKQAGVTNPVPVVQTREMESIIKVDSGQIAVLGGLMQDEVSKQSDEVPFMGRIPLFGNLFKSRVETLKKSELVVFLRPIVIKDGGIDGDFSEFKSSLPNDGFFGESKFTGASAEKSKP